MPRKNLTIEEAVKVDEMLDDCSEVLGVRNCPFDEWQREFVIDITEQWDDSRSMTEAQYDKLCECWGII